MVLADKNLLITISKCDIFFITFSDESHLVNLSNKGSHNIKDYNVDFESVIGGFVFYCNIISNANSMVKKTGKCYPFQLSYLFEN